MLKGWTTGRLLSWLKWSEGRTKSFVAQRYEPLLRFDPTPVYQITLATEIANVNDANSYNIYMSDYVQDKAKAFWCHIVFPAYTESGTLGSLRCRARYTKADGSDEVTSVGQINNVLGNTSRYYNSWNYGRDNNIEVFSNLSNANGAGNIAAMGKGSALQPRIIDINQYFLKGISLYFNSDGIPFPKNTEITLYVAKEA